jgi:co-chaperonin GroES (HSP10)
MPCENCTSDTNKQLDSAQNQSGDGNTFTVLEGKLALKAVGRRIIVKEDKFRTGYECSTCDGEGFINEPCQLCKGETTEKARDQFDNEVVVPCRLCRGNGKKICPDCKGKGGLLVAPEVTERRPTSGVVMSVGDDVGVCECTLNANWRTMKCSRCGGTGKLSDRIKVGDHVLYGNYAGHLITLKNKAAVRIMNEDEVTARIFAVKDFNFGQVTA